MFERLMIARALFTGDFAPNRPGVCSNEGGEGGGGGGGPANTDPPKTFTQEDVNRIAAKQKAEGERVARERAEADFKAREAEHLKRIEELELAGKSQAERDAHERKQREDADRKAREAVQAQLTRERDEERQKREAAETRYKQDRVSRAVTDALHAAKVIGSAAPDAALSFIRDAKIDVDEDGNVTNVIYGGKSYPKVDEAAKQFLLDKAHFAQPSGGGAGTRSPAGGAGATSQPGRPLHERSREELLALSKAEREARGNR